MFRILRPQHPSSTSAGILFGLLALSPLNAMPVAAQHGQWTADCGGADLRIFGGNLHGEASQTVAIPGGRDADSIVVEVIGKGNTVPSACTISGKDARGSMPKGVDLMPVGLGNQEAKRFRSRVEPTDAVYVSTNDPEGSAAVIVYAFFGSEARADQRTEAKVASGEFSAYYLYNGSWESSLPLAPAMDQRDVEVLVPIAGLAGEERVAIVHAEAGGVQGMASAFGRKEDRFQLLRIRLEGVPATAERVNLRVLSPQAGDALGQGGSFTFGTVVRSACHADVAVACGSESSIEVVQRRISAGGDHSIFIDDVASVEFMEVEAWMPNAGQTASLSLTPMGASVRHMLQTRASGERGPMVFRSSLAPTRAFTVESDHPEQDLYVTVRIRRRKAGKGRAFVLGQSFSGAADMQLQMPSGVEARQAFLRVPVLADAPLRVSVEMDGKTYSERWVPKKASAEDAAQNRANGGMQAGMLNLPLEMIVESMGMGQAELKQGTIAIHVASEKSGAKAIASAVLEVDCATTPVCAAPPVPVVTMQEAGQLALDWSASEQSRRYRLCVEAEGKAADCQSTSRTNMRWDLGQNEQQLTLRLQRQCADGQVSEASVLELNADGLARLAAESGTDGQDLELMPNPAQSFTVLRRVLAQTDAQVAVRDLQGRVHMEEVFASGETQLRLDLSGLSPGSYLIEMREGDRQTVRRLIRTE